MQVIVLDGNKSSIGELEEQWVNRDNELSLCSQSIIRLGHNVLVYGERGIGKTFLVRKLHKIISDENPEIFPIFINLSGLHAYAEDAASAFPRAILIQLCSAIWTKIFNKEYLSLREDLSEKGFEVNIKSKAEKTVHRIYKHLMLTSRKTTYEWSNVVGFSAGAKGEKSEKGVAESEPLKILPFEFLEFAEELYESVLLPNGKTRVVALCDEANVLPQFEQENILERYLSLFAVRQIQFLFVAGFYPWDQIPSLPRCFETFLELKGLCEKDTHALLVHTAQALKVSVPLEASRIFHTQFKGNPRLILMAFSEAAPWNGDKSPIELTTIVTLKACSRVEQHRESIKESYQRQRGKIS